MEEKTEKLTYKDKLKFANAISKPMASKSTTKRLMKLIRKGMIVNYCISEVSTLYLFSLFNFLILAQPLRTKAWELDLKMYRSRSAAAKKGIFYFFYLSNVLISIFRCNVCIFFGRLVIFGADVTPVDIICHMPAICEEKDLPYCYTPSREDIGHAAGLHRTAVMVLIKKHSEYAEFFDEITDEVKRLPIPS